MLTHAICACNHNANLTGISQSKDELDCELNVARKICLTRRLAETGTARIQIRIAELRMIESVKKFCAQLEPGTFAERKRSNHRQIGKHQRLPAKPRQVRRQGPYVI